MDGKHGPAVAGERSELATGVRYFMVHCIDSLSSKYLFMQCVAGFVELVAQRETWAPIELPTQQFFCRDPDVRGDLSKKDGRDIAALVKGNSSSPTIRMVKLLV